MVTYHEVVRAYFHIHFEEEDEDVECVLGLYYENCCWP